MICRHISRWGCTCIWDCLMGLAGLMQRMHTTNRPSNMETCYLIVFRSWPRLLMWNEPDYSNTLLWNEEQLVHTALQLGMPKHGSKSGPQPQLASVHPLCPQFSVEGLLLKDLSFKRLQILCFPPHTVRTPMLARHKLGRITQSIVLLVVSLILGSQTLPKIF